MAAHKSVTEPKVIFMLVHIWVWQVLNWHIVGRICISKFGDVRLQTGHTPIFVDSNVFGTEYKIQCVWINRTSCFKKRPANLIVFTFWFEHMRRVASHFPKFIPPKVGRNPCFLTFWLGNAFPATTAALFPHPDVRKWSEPVLSHHKNDQFFHWTPKHGPNKTVCFVYFDLDLCFVPKQQVPKLVPERLTCRSAPRHNRIPFCHTRTLKTGPALLFFINLDCAPHRSASLFYAFRISIVAEKVFSDCHPGSTRHIAGEFGVPDLDGNSVARKRRFDNLDLIFSEA